MWRAALVAGLLLATPARAGTLAPLSQDRRVELLVVETTQTWESGFPLFDPPTETTRESFAEGASAPDIGAFEATASLAAFPGSSASQTSQIQARRITATGSLTTLAEAQAFFTPPPPFALVTEQHDSRSALSVAFEISSPCAFALSGSVGASGGFSALSQTAIRLLGPGGSVVAELAVATDPGCVDPECLQVGPESLLSRGTLHPGVYTLEAEALGTALSFYSPSVGPVDVATSGAFDLELALAESVPAWGEAWGPLALAAALAAAAAGRLRRASARPRRAARR